MTALLSPPLTAAGDVDATLRRDGHAVLSAASLRALCGLAGPAFEPWLRFWGDLPPDWHLRDGGRYRHRRHSCFVVRGEQVELVPHRTHWQPVEYNALHGGIERHFEPMPPEWIDDPAWTRLLAALAARATALRGAQDWYVEAHPFRIDTTDGIGRPTPEGAHRDGVDLVAVLLVDRRDVKGGETRVFDAHGPLGLRFTLTESFSVLLLDDARVVHETTPIQPIDAARAGHRDTLVLTFRAQGFQGPAH
jgi:hypothetical protein